MTILNFEIMVHDLLTRAGAMLRSLQRIDDNVRFTYTWQGQAATTLITCDKIENTADEKLKVFVAGQIQSAIEQMSKK